MHERLRVGQALSISAPRNLFALRAGSHHVLVAGGIGITPLLAMARRLEQLGRKWELYYAARSSSETMPETIAATPLRQQIVRALQPRGAGSIVSLSRAR